MVRFTRIGSIVAMHVRSDRARTAALQKGLEAIENDVLKEERESLKALRSVNNEAA